MRLHREQLYRKRRCAKNDLRTAPHRSATASLTRSGGITSGRWLRRRSRITSQSDPAAPYEAPRRSRAGRVTDGRVPLRLAAMTVSVLVLEPG